MRRAILILLTLSASILLVRHAVSQYPGAVLSPLGGKTEFRPGGYFPAGFPLHGQVRLLTPPVVEMGTRNRHRVEYRVGDVAIETGMTIEVWKHFTSDMEEFQTVQPEAAAYFGVEMPPGVGGKTVAHTNWVQRNDPSVFPYRKAAGITITKGRLKAGDVVKFDLGGPRGVQMQFYEENLFNLRFVIWKDNAVLGYAGDAALKVTGGPLAQLRVMAPSVVKAGESFAVEVVPLDAWVSVAKNGKGLSLEMNAPGLSGAALVWDPQLEHYIARGVKVSRTGTLRLDVRTTDGRAHGVSNPVWVEADPLRGVYYGELHQHTYLADGRGVFDELYLYGRRVGLLDFGAVTPHHTFLTGANGPSFYLRGKKFPVDEWPKLQQVTKSVNGWQGFVSLLGYEYSVGTALGGHHNVFYNADKTPSVMHLNAREPNAPVAKMLETLKLSRVPTLVIPHIGGGPPDWSHPTDLRIERLFEIASVHGVFEESWQKHLANGVRLGAIAAGDTHTSSMGIAYPGLIYVNQNGLAGVLAHGKSRKEIWEGLYERRTFATTGNQRMLVDFRVNGEAMGGEIPAGNAKDARIEARVSGTAPLLRVELIKNNKVIEAQSPARSNGSLVRVVWGDNLYQRRAAVGLRSGEMRPTQGTLKLLSTVNLDQAFEEVRQDGTGVVWRTAAVSNDRDGFLADISQAGGTLRFRLDDSDNMGVVEFEVVVAELRKQGRVQLRRVSQRPQAQPYMRQMGVEPAFFLECDVVNPHASMDAAFQFQDREKPKSGDFYYLRVEQLDTNKAWSSPVWMN
ncbi:MAG: hypothetical protein HY820_22320 [Acidobacteria bacterium]|nr:hypothetical protein [Acidobacteriota bacterium]